MGAEAAYTWEYASALSCRAEGGLDRATFRAFRRALLEPMGTSSGRAGTDAQAGASPEDAHGAVTGGVASSADEEEGTDSHPSSSAAGGRPGTGATRCSARLAARAGC